jgi:hypothetical protein
MLKILFAKFRAMQFHKYDSTLDLTLRVIVEVFNKEVHSRETNNSENVPLG